MWRYMRLKIKGVEDGEWRFEGFEGFEGFGFGFLGCVCM